MNFKESIDKDIELHIDSETQKKISLKWEAWLRMDWRVNFVPDEMRKNPLSKIESQYILFVGHTNGYRRYRCYVNIHDYIDYLRTFFKNAIILKRYFKDMSLFTSGIKRRKY